MPKFPIPQFIKEDDEVILDRLTAPIESINALSYWFPKLLAARLPTPRTIIVPMPQEAQKDFWRIFDHQKPSGASALFILGLAAAAEEIGFPCFLRSDHTSDKHEWEKTCFVTSVEQLADHAERIAYFSECCGAGPWQSWAVRELLPTIPLGVCPNYGNMPICKEFRFFVDDGAIRCAHPYWPLFSLRDGGVPESFDYETLCRMDNEPQLRQLAEAAGRAVPGSWSIDLLETHRGWHVTDMAAANRSWHWEGCPLS